MGLSLALALGGWAWEAARFGLTGDVSSARVEREVRGIVDVRSQQVRVLAEAVANKSALVAAAAAAPSSPDATLPLTNQLDLSLQRSGLANTSITV